MQTCGCIHHCCTVITAAGVVGRRNNTNTLEKQSSKHSINSFCLCTCSANDKSKSSHTPSCVENNPKPSVFCKPTFLAVLIQRRWCLKRFNCSCSTVLTCANNADTGALNDAGTALLVESAKCTCATNLVGKISNSPKSIAVCQQNV